MNTFWFVVLGIVVVALVLWAIATYNRLVRLRTAVQAQWKQIDVELQRRYDLIPNLISTVKGAAGFESSVLEKVTAARAAALDARGQSPAARSGPEEGLTSALKNLFAVAEAYPALTATGNYRALQEELANTEDRIAASRSFYNQNVEEFNASILTIPTRFIASPFGFHSQEYFEVNDPEVRAAINVQFDENGL